MKASLQLKDLRLAQGLAAAAGVRLPHVESTVDLYERLIAQSGSDLDHSAVHGLL